MLEMFSKKINKAKNQKGFTLVELIVVVAILGILAAVAVGRFGGFTDKAKVNADLSSASTIASAAQAHIADFEGTAGADNVTIDKLVTEGVLEKPQASKTNNEDFVVKYDPANQKVTVGDKKSTFYPQHLPTTPVAVTP